MNWQIERDEKGEPFRMWLMRYPPEISAREKERQRLLAINSLPMPSMREWAEKRGITNETIHQRL